MDDRLEHLLQIASSLPTRRAVLRGLAGVLGAAGVAALSSREDISARRRRRRRRECRRNNQCEASLNPCQKVRCKRGRCRKKTLANGTVCGDGLICQSGACLCPDGVCTVQVTPSNPGAWVGLADCGCGTGTVDNSLLAFRSGPGSPPFGSGSVELTGADPLDFVALGTYQFANTRLSQITTLQYATYQPNTNLGTDIVVGILQFGIDFFGDNFPLQGRLVYDPSLNGQPVAQDTWQTWDAINGGSASWYFAGGFGVWPDTGDPGIPDTDPMTWAQIVAKYPEARINFNDPVFAIEITGNPEGP
ncbi:MAG: hypothetical protein KC442_24400, partial [Thermomicrobiales bacterium]|nr:hypothetical protein [Thermomicrobiales bacterium]